MSINWLLSATVLILVSTSTASLAQSQPSIPIGDLITESFGFQFNGVTANRESANFTFSGSSNDLLLNVTGFDIDSSTEVRVLVNDVSIGFLTTTPNNETGPSSITIPSSRQVTGTNSIEFRQRVPNWFWGITNLLLSVSASSTPEQLTLDNVNESSYGNRFNGVTANEESALFTFSGSSSDLILSVTGYDIDSGNEVNILVNGVSVGFLARTPNNATGPSSIQIPLNTQVAGTNSIEFRQRVPGWTWGIADLILSEAPAPQFDLSNYQLSFEDNFNGSSLDPTKWDTGLLWGPYFPYADYLYMRS